MISKEEVIEIFKNAALPYRAVPEFWDYDDKFRIKVFGKDSCVLFEHRMISADSMRNEQSLGEFVKEMRHDLGLTET